MSRAEDFKEMMRHVAEEINVKRITMNGWIVYDEPLLKDKYKEKQQQFDEIYSEYQK